MAEENVRKNNDHRSKDSVRRIILIGKTGNGKSSTGNTILGYPDFKNEISAGSVTQSCEVRTSIARKDWPLYVVCDTPGLLDTDVDIIDRALEINKSVKIMPNPHAFLLVFSLASRMTLDENSTIDLIRIMFGEDVFEHCIIVFTRGNELKRDVDFESFLKKSPMLITLIEKCGNRVVRIENENSTEHSNIRIDVRRLLELLEEVSVNGQIVYEYRYLQIHEKELEDHRQNYKGKSDIWSKLTDISNNLGKCNSQWKTALYMVFLGGSIYVGMAAMPEVGNELGGAVGGAIGGFFGGFVRMAAINIVKNFKFW